MHGPALLGKHITLRALAESEFRPLAQLWSDPRVTRYESARLAVQPVPWWEQWLRDSAVSASTLLWAVERQGELIGMTALRDLNLEDRNATGSLALHPDHWGHGYASETVELRSRHAFLGLGLEKVRTQTSDENVAIKRALLRAGYLEVGIARRERLRDGHWQDEWLAELLRENWLRRRG